MKRLPMADRLGEIRRLYFATTRATIARDFETALDLLKGMDSEDERSRATVFMHGLAQMRADWTRNAPPEPTAGPRRRSGTRSKTGR